MRPLTFRTEYGLRICNENGLAVGRGAFLVLAAEYRVCASCGQSVPHEKVRYFDRPLLPEVEKPHRVVNLGDHWRVIDHVCPAVEAVRLCAEVDS